jgi:RNA polymerase sigma factor (sigma-70 family)
MNLEPELPAATQSRIDNFSAIVERHQDLVWAIAFAATGDAAASDDIAQDTFLAAWKQQADIRELAKMRSYLASIARNLSYREFRGQDRELLDDGEQALTLPSEEPTPLDRILADEQRSQVERALRSIPAASREPFVLFYLEDKAVSRVAADLDLSESAVKQRLYRARESLKSSVAEQLAAQITHARPALGAAVIALILAQATKAVATTGAAATQAAVLAPSQIATSPPLAAQALKPAATHTAIAGAGAFVLVGKVGAALAALALALLIYSDNKDADASGAPDSAQAHAQAQAQLASASAAEPSRPSPSLETTEEASVAHVEVASEQPLITGRLRINVEGADADEDGQISEEEVEEVRRSQEELLLQLIGENWAAEGVQVGCSTVGLDDDGVFEGGTAFIIDDLRSAHAQDSKDGVDLTLQEWIASNFVASSREGSICYNTRARFTDDVRQLKAEYQGQDVQWQVSAFAISGDSFYIGSPPKELSKELAMLQGEEAAHEVVERWGVRISANRNNTFFYAVPSGYQEPATMHRHPAIEALVQDHEDERLAELDSDEVGANLPQGVL